MPERRAEPAPPGPRHRAPGSARRSPLRVGQLWLVAAVVVLVVLGLRAAQARPRPAEGRLAADGYSLIATRAGLPAVAVSPDGLGARLVAGYALLTRAFDRHDALVAAGRELLVVATVVAAVLVWLTGRRLGLSRPACALAALLAGVPALLPPADLVDSPARLAVPWLVGAACLVAPGRPTRTAGLLALAAAAMAVLLAPVTLPLVLAGATAAAVIDRRLPPAARLPVVLAGVVLYAVVLVLLGRWDPRPATAGAWGVSTAAVGLATAACGLVGLAAARRSPHRPAGHRAAAGLAARPAPSVRTRRRPHRHRRRRVARLPVRLRPRCPGGAVDGVTDGDGPGDDAVPREETMEARPIAPSRNEPVPLEAAMRRLIRALAVTGAVAALALLGVPAASAADGGYLRLAHLSPDTPTVDVYIDDVADPAGMVTLHAVGYGTVSDYQQVPPGTYAVSMRAAGADPNSPPVLSTTVEVAPNTARTVAGVGPFSDLRLKVLDDDLTMPPPGTTRMRVINAAAAAQSLDVAAPGAGQVASGLASGAAGPYVALPGGQTTLQVTPAGGAPTDLPVTLAAGSVYSVLVLDRPEGGLTVRTALDAASMDMTFMPVGGVETGAGGTAGTSPAGPVALGVALAATVALLATYGIRRRAAHAARC